MTAILVRFKWHGDRPRQERARPPTPSTPRRQTTDPCNKVASWGKAYTAVGFAPILKLDSGGEVAERVAQFSARQPAGTLPFQPPEGMIFRAGGLTIKLGDEVIGAIGVGGAPTAQADEACARAGLDKIRDRLR